VKKRILVLLTVATVMLVMGAGVALAVNRQCNGTPCRGTNNNDVLYERVGNHKSDRILGLRGSDDMSAALYTRDRDRLFGGPNGDRIVVNDGDSRDLANGGRGRDICYIDRGDRTRSCNSTRVAAAGVNPSGFGNTATNSEN
jgi:hypothetical protein